MSVEQQHFSVSMKASVSMALSQFRAIKISAAHTMALGTTEDYAIGVLQDKPVANAVGKVAIVGITKAVAGGVVAAGDWVGPGKSSKLIKKIITDTGITATFNCIMGQALSAAAAEDEIFSLLLTGAGAGRVG